jgi:hypothetical protein
VITSGTGSFEDWIGRPFLCIIVVEHQRHGVVVVFCVMYGGTRARGFLLFLLVLGAHALSLLCSLSKVTHGLVSLSVFFFVLECHAHAYSRSQSAGVSFFVIEGVTRACGVVVFFFVMEGGGGICSLSRTTPDTLRKRVGSSLLSDWIFSMSFGRFRLSMNWPVESPEDEDACNTWNNGGA